MPAIPLIVGGVSAASSAWQAHKAGQVAGSQQQLMGQQSNLANEIGSFARGQSSMAQPALNKAMQYYMTLANGNRGAIDSALAPERAQITDNYAGAEKGLNARLAAGPQRDRAIADLYKQRAGQLGLMPLQARAGAVENLGKMGQGLAGNALNAYSGASSALNGASNTGRNYMEAQSNSNKMWNSTINSGRDLAMGAYDWYKRSRT